MIYTVEEPPRGSARAAEEGGQLLDSAKHGKSQHAYKSMYTGFNANTYVYIFYSYLICIHVYMYISIYVYSIHRYGFVS